MGWCRERMLQHVPGILLASPCLLLRTWQLLSGTVVFDDKSQKCWRHQQFLCYPVPILLQKLIQDQPRMQDYNLNCTC